MRRIAVIGVMTHGGGMSFCPRPRAQASTESFIAASSMMKCRN